MSFEKYFGSISSINSQYEMKSFESKLLSKYSIIKLDISSSFLSFKKYFGCV
jgi:hypothetical protein